MTKAEDKRLEELKAELTKAQVERDTYLASAQMMDRMSKKLLDLDDFRLLVNEQLKQQFQGVPEHLHEEPESGEEA